MSETSGEFKVGDRVRFSPPGEASGSKYGAVVRVYSVSRPFAEVELDNGQKWLAQLADLRRAA